MSLITSNKLVVKVTCTFIDEILELMTGFLITKKHVSI